MKALIVGGGIAGPVAAMALQREGIEPVVFEAHPQGADGVGSFLTVAVNGLQALKAIGLDGLPGFATPRFAMYLGNGRKIAELPNGPVLSDGTVSLTVKRAELYAFIRDEAVKRGIRIEYGKRLERVDGQVTACFEDGTSATGDLLIGADGLRSRVRSLIDPRAPKAEFVGLLNCGGFAKRGSVDVELEGDPGVFHMIFGKRCFFGWILDPERNVWWFANPSRDREPDAAELAATDWRTELLGLFEGDATPAAAIIRASETVSGGWASYDFRRVPTWHRDRMIIIGDAAHAASPSSGQGASMAMEDAVVLASSLKSSSNIEAAFADYEQRRRERVEKIVAQGRRNGSGKSPGPVGRVIRDLMMPMVFRWLEKQGQEPLRWIYDYRAATP